MRTLYNSILVLLMMAMAVQSKSQTQVDSMTFHKDYFPGQNDINGQYLGSTETMAIVQHKGKLYAGMGNWMDYPVTLQSEGTQVLRKDSYNSPWVVDTTVGYTSLRSEALVSVFFNKDINGQTLNPPANILVGGFSDIIPPYDVSIWVRNDTTNIWHRNTAYTLTVPGGGSAIRSFCIHTDKVTGKQWLFAGVSVGSVIKAAYNPSLPGLLQIDTTQEMVNAGRVMCMTVCNGDLYAAAGVDIVAGDTVGGLYRRIDGINPTWQLVYLWPYTPSGGDEFKIMRGLTCVPDPNGSNNQVLIGTRAGFGFGNVEVIEPFNNHHVYTEFGVRDFFSNLWWGGAYPYATLTAYNNFAADTLNGNPVWWVSLSVIHPGWANHPFNGSYFLQRNLSGDYKWGHVYDNNHPLPPGQTYRDGLRATRTICKSPFTEDLGKVYYFGGYDAANDTSNNTAWIYKGVMQSPVTGITEPENQFSGMSVYPNPTQNHLTISNLPNDFSGTVSIYNTIGQLMFSEKKNGSQSSIQTGHLNTGIYFVQVKTYKGGMITKKFIKA